MTKLCATTVVLFLTIVTAIEGEDSIPDLTILDTNPTTKEESKHTFFGFI